MTISKRLLPDTIGHRALTGHDSYGKPTHAAPVSYPYSREMKSQRRIEQPGGEVILREGKAVFSVPISINADDLVVLPDGTEHRVITVQKGRDGTGRDHHTTVEYV